MKETTLYQIDSLYRDPFRVKGYIFGEGTQSLCIMGSLRGNEIQQIYVCSQLIQCLKLLEKEVEVSQMVTEGELLGKVLDPCTGDVLENIYAPTAGAIFFLYTDPLVYEKTAVFKIAK